jgi:isopenicillin N synthase-like dioxygenase
MSLAQAAKAPDLEHKASFNALPIIDLTNMCSPDPAERRAVAQEIRNACFTAGFFYVKNHGVPSEIIDRAYNAMKQFFGLPIEKKMKLDSRSRSTLRGYQPLFSATNDQTNGVTDAHEGFEFGAEDPDPLKSNIWPSEEDLPRFRKDVVSYYDAAVELGKGLFPLFALAMDLPEDYFKDKTKGSGALIHLLHYPERPQSEVGNPLQMGIGAHTDWECFTILWQQPNTLALEVMNAGKQWISAPPLEGTFVVNIGDQFARWTSILLIS